MDPKTDAAENPQDAWRYALIVNDAPFVRQTLMGDPQKARTPLLQQQPWGQEWWLPLHLAAHDGANDVLQVLIDASVQPNSRTRFRTPFHARQTALHLACRRGHTETTQRLVAAGADPDLLDAHHQSPLHVAAAAGAAAALKLLIDADATVSLTDSNARTALHLAIDALAQGNPNGLVCAEHLLTAGANPDAEAPKDRGRQTPRLRVQTLEDLSLKTQTQSLFDAFDQKNAAKAGR